MKYIKNLAVESVTVFSYFVSSETRKKIPAFFVYLILFCLMIFIAVSDLVKFLWRKVMVSDE